MNTPGFYKKLYVPSSGRQKQFQLYTLYTGIKEMLWFIVSVPKFNSKCYNKSVSTKYKPGFPLALLCFWFLNIS